MIRFLLISLLTILSAAVTCANREALPAPTPTPMKAQSAETQLRQLTPRCPRNRRDHTAVYEVISGPAGKKRDWDRMRSPSCPARA